MILYISFSLSALPLHFLVWGEQPCKRKKNRRRGFNTIARTEKANYPLTQLFGLFLIPDSPVLRAAGAGI